MSKRPSKKSSKKTLKSVTFSPFASVNPPVPSAATRQPVHEVSQLKRTVNGGLKIVSHKVIPDNEASTQQITPTKPTVEEVISTFLKESEDKGWDQGYVDSFWDTNVSLSNLDEVDTANDEHVDDRGLGVSDSRLLLHILTHTLQDKALHRWVPEIDFFLKSMITLEGRSPGTSSCQVCGKSDESNYRCVDCDNIGHLCESCMVHTHRSLPLHRIQVGYTIAFPTSISVHSRP